MDDLFYNSPTFCPGSKWVPKSHLDEDANNMKKHEIEDIGKGGDGTGLKHSEHVEVLP